MQQLWVGTSDGRVVVFDCLTGMRVGQFVAHSQAVDSLVRVGRDEVWSCSSRETGTGFRWAPKP